MPIDADAFLFYGIRLDEDNLPWDKGDERGYADDWFNQNKIDMQISYIHYQSYDSPKYGIAVESFHAYLGKDTPVDFEILPGHADLLIKEFCVKAGIEYQEPRWWLVSQLG